MHINRRDRDIDGFVLKRPLRNAVLWCRSLSRPSGWFRWEAPENVDARVTSWRRCAL